MKQLILFTILTLIGGSTFAQTVDLEDFLTGLDRPVDMQHAGDDRLFIVEQKGAIVVVDENGNVLPTEFLNIEGLVASPLDPIPGYKEELGLLGLAFHPDYENNGYFYVNYTNEVGGNFNTIIERYTISADENVADASSGVEIMSIPQPFSNHNGGGLGFGPDGYLYIGTGDGGSGNDPGNRAQNGMSLLGKMLRIDVDGGTPYAIPADNPFVGDATVLDEIWALGLRNPWRYSWDQETNELWIADVGQNAREEVIVEPAGFAGGANYGWRCREGFIAGVTAGCGPASDYDDPVFDYPHSGAMSGLSITGGYVYRGCEYPGLVGNYIFIDYVSGNLWTLKSDGMGGYTNTFQSSFETSVSAFGQDVEGELYVIKLNGVIKKVIETDVGEVVDPEITFANTTISTTETGDSFQWFFNDMPIANATNNSYEFIGQDGEYYVEITRGNCVLKSNELFVGGQSIGNRDNVLPLQVSPNPTQSDLFITSDLDLSDYSVNVIDIVGKEVSVPFSGNKVNVSALPNGVYTIVLNGDKVFQNKFVIAR